MSPSILDLRKGSGEGAPSFWAASHRRPSPSLRASGLALGAPAAGNPGCLTLLSLRGVTGERPGWDGLVLSPGLFYFISKETPRPHNLGGLAGGPHSES